LKSVYFEVLKGGELRAEFGLGVEGLDLVVVGVCDEDSVAVDPRGGHSQRVLKLALPTHSVNIPKTKQILTKHINIYYNIIERDVGDGT
jgi:hypothetical protein